MGKRRHKIRYKNHGCLFCGKCYVAIYQLDDHIRSHTRERPFVCNTCGKDFSNVLSYREHRKIHQENYQQKFSACVFCNKMFSPIVPCRHIYSHIGERPYQCPKCQYGCYTATQLRLHMTTHGTEKRFKCDKCKMKFINAHQLKQHQNRVHLKKTKFKCPICQHVLSYRQSMDLHMRTHTGEMPFKCKLCTKSFKCQSSLKNHRRVHDPEIKKLDQRQCSVCKKIYCSMAGLKEHMKSVHSVSRPFRCQLCPKAFTRRTKFKYHMVTHTGEKVYQCKFCTAAFNCGNGLHQHVNRHHDKSKNVKVTCEICQKSVTKTDMKEHRDRHFKVMRHICVFCAKGFVKKTELLAHTKHHIKEKAIWCKACDGEFFVPGELRSHKLRCTKKSCLN